jgi:hypothetical protein
MYICTCIITVNMCVCVCVCKGGEEVGRYFTAAGSLCLFLRRLGITEEIDSQKLTSKCNYEAPS